MNCPRCNAVLNENSIKCSNCGAKVGRLCPSCKSYNIITNKTCTHCGEVLLKVCPVCNSVNIPSSKLCRKCGAELDEFKLEAPIEANSDEELTSDDVANLSYDANYFTLAAAKETVMDSIYAQNIKVISINGNNEPGKNYVFRSLMKETSSAGIAWLMGKCTPHTQLTPVGYFQNVLLNLFNVTNFCTNKKQLKKESVKFFKEDFNNLSTQEIYDLLNLLYPENVDKYQYLENNKQNTIRIIVKIFESIVLKMNTVLLIENVEYIDSFSYELLNILISNDIIREKITFILSFAKEQSGVNCINAPCLTDNNYLDVTITPFSKEQIEPIFGSYKDLNMTSDLKSKILHFGKDNPILVEQLINLIADYDKAGQELHLYEDLESVMQKRLSILKQTDYDSYLLLSACAILGFRFYPMILNGIFNQQMQSIEDNLSKLIKLNYIIPSANIGCEFKTLAIWNIILDFIKQDSEIFRAVNQALYQLLSEYMLSTPAILGFISQNLNYNEQTISIWYKCLENVAYIGDTGLYIILQKQILNGLEDSKLDNVDQAKSVIYAELGKLLEPQNPQLALEYLPKAITMCNEDDFVKKIELLGYLASASMRLKNYHGVIECVHAALQLVPETFVVEIAMLKSREVKALEMLGNSGAVVNLVDNDVLPVLLDCLNGRIQCKTIEPDQIFDTLLRVQLTLARCLSMQGDNRAFKIIENIKEICKANAVENQVFMTDVDSALAFAHTISGNIPASIKILDKIFKTEQISDVTMSRINLISVLNRFFMNKNDLAYDELFQAAQYAEDVNDDFTKNILKLILGRLMQDRTSAKEAANIYTKQIEYFADKQNAIGVLLGWYFISKAKFVIDGPNEALDIAVKALDIASSPNIANNYFVMLFNKLIGEIYLVLQDFDATKMYLEKAILIAKNYDIKYQLVKIYLLYTKYLQDYSLHNDKNIDSILTAQQMIQKALILSDDLKSVYLESEIEKAKAVLNSFCQMNGIALK